MIVTPQAYYIVWGAVHVLRTKETITPFKNLFKRPTWNTTLLAYQLLRWVLTSGFNNINTNGEDARDKKKTRLQLF